MNKKYRITANLDYVQGFLKNGYKEMILNEDEYKKFVNLSLEEQVKWLENKGDFEITDYSIEDYGDIDSRTLQIDEI